MWDDLRNEMMKLMTSTGPRSRTLIVSPIVIGVFIGATLTHAEENAVQVDVLWSSVISDGHKDTSSNVADFTLTPDGGLALYQQTNLAPTEVQVLHHDGSNTIKVEPSGRVYHIAANSDGSFFLAGSIKKTHGWFSFEKRPSDAYIIHLAQSGDVVWEQSFGDVGFQGALDVATFPNGGAVLAVGGENRSASLWALDSTGKSIWDVPLGIKNAAIQVVPAKSTIVAVTLDNAGREPRSAEYSEDVALVLFDLDGNELSRTVVRPDINRVSGSYFLKAFVESSDTAITVSTAWDYFRRDHEDYKPFEVATYDYEGRLIWRRRPSGECETAPMMLPNGEVLVACAEPFDGRSRHLVLTRYQGNGDSTETRAILPECHQTQHAVAIYPVALEQNTLTLLASRPVANVGDSCNWAGTIQLR